MSVLAGVVRVADGINRFIGRATAWLVLAVVLIGFSVVVLRYGFEWGDIRFQEAYVWLHAVVFMIGAGYTLADDGHVRVDVFYARMSPRKRAWVNLLGTVFFLLPWLGVIVYFGWPFVSTSWALLEPSAEPGGLPGYFILKSVIMAFCAVVGLQAFAIIARSLLVISGHEEWSFGDASH